MLVLVISVDGFPKRVPPDVAEEPPKIPPDADEELPKIPPDVGAEPPKIPPDVGAEPPKIPLLSKDEGEAGLPNKPPLSVLCDEKVDPPPKMLLLLD